MRKEILIAIIVGIGVGIAVAFGIWRANSAIKTNLPELPQILQKVTPTATPQEFKITIYNVEQNDVITESPVAIAGITKANSLLVISGEDEDYVLVTGADGSFSQEVDLATGVNQIVFAVFDAADDKTETILKVVYSSEFAEGSENPDSPPPSDKPENDVRETVQEKLQVARQNPKAYIGTVTDKLGDSLQVSDENDEIQLVSVNPENVSFAKVSTSTSDITYDDVAIGDYVVAMGTRNGNNVLTAVRILVTDPLDDPTRSILLGTITDISRNDATIQLKDGSEVTLDFPRSWKGPDLDELDEGQKLIAVGELNGNTLDIRTIEVAETSEISPTADEE